MQKKTIFDRNGLVYYLDDCGYHELDIRGIAFVRDSLQRLETQNLTLTGSLKDLKKAIDDINISIDASKLAKELTLTSGISEIKAKIDNISPTIDISTLAKLNTLTLGILAIKDKSDTNTQTILTAIGGIALPTPLTDELVHSIMDEGE